MYFIKEIFGGLVAIEYCTLDLQWKSDWSRAINQFTIASEVDKINTRSAGDIAFIMLRSKCA